MEKQYLTPEDQLMLDPYGNNRNFIKQFPSLKGYYAAPSSYYSVTPDEMKDRVEALERRLRCKKHIPYFTYVDEMWSKWGPQGGRYPWNEMEAKLSNYYVRAANKHEVRRVLAQGRDFLIRRIKQVMRCVGGPQYTATHLYGTAAALPTGLHKGDYLAEVTGMKPFRHMFPALLGQRRMRCKDRLIFQDSVCNVRYVESELTAVRNWLKSYLPEYFSAWLRPDLVQDKILTDALEHRDTFVETDYIGMDEGFSFDIVREIILPIYEVLIPDSFLSFAAAIEEQFNQPVYMGTYLVTGLHNLFSGIGCTNDFETEYTVCLALGTALELNCLEKTQMTVLGDDCTIALRTQSHSLPREFLNCMIETSNAADMLIHDDEKSRIASGETRFCRKVYYLSGTRNSDGTLLGAYPFNLAVNSIIQPERPSKTEGIAAVADLQRMDNCYGVPGWTELVQMLLKLSSHKFSCLDVTASPIDWWERLYGERWDPASSPSFTTMRQWMNSEPSVK